MNKKLVDRIITGLIFIGGIYLYTKTRDFPAGADSFPKFLIVVTIILSGIMLLQGFFRDKEGKGEDTNRVDFIKQPFIIYGFIIVYLLLIINLGFFVSTLLFLPAVMYYFNFRRFKVLMIPTLVMLLLVYFLFVRELHVPLPQGIFF